MCVLLTDVILFRIWALQAYAMIKNCSISATSNGLWIGQCILHLNNDEVHIYCAVIPYGGGG
jgi:hypothetical protein